MPLSSSNIKAIAKDVLKNNLISSIIATISVLSVMFVVNNIAVVMRYIAGDLALILTLCLLWVFLVLPLMVGLIRYFWRLCCAVRDNPVVIFHYFSAKRLYFKALGLVLSLLIRVFVCFVVACIPLFIAELIASSWLYSALDVSIPIWTVNLTDVIGILKVIAFATTLVSSFKYYLAPMLFVADENITIAEAIHLSTVISKRTLFDFSLFLVTFIGWIFLSFMVLPLILTIPYFIISYLIYSTTAVDAFNEKIRQINREDIPTYIAGV